MLAGLVKMLAGVSVSDAIVAELIGLVVGMASSLLRGSSSGIAPSSSVGEDLAALGATLPMLALLSQAGAQVSLQLCMRLVHRQEEGVPKALLDWMQNYLKASPLAPLRAGVQSASGSESSTSYLDVTTLPYALTSSDVQVRLDAIKKLAELVDETVQRSEIAAAGSAAMTDSEDEEDSRRGGPHGSSARTQSNSFMRSAVALRQFDEDASVARQALDLETKMILAGAGHAADVHEAGVSIGQHDIVLDGTPGVAVSRFSKVEQYWQRVATSQASSSEEVIAANEAV